MTTGELIQVKRKEKGYTQKQLAEKCGVATGTIQQYELNKREPRQEQLRKIAEALNISLNDLIPDSFEQTIQAGRELLARDYGLIEAMANHRIFTAKERKTIFQEIEKHLEILSTLNDSNKAQEYSDKTHTELEDELLKMLINKPDYDTSNAIIVLSCFLSLKGDDQESIVTMLLEYCYPNKNLKYCGTFADEPPEE